MWEISMKMIFLNMFELISEFPFGALNGLPQLVCTASCFCSAHTAALSFSTLIVVSYSHLVLDWMGWVCGRVLGWLWGCWPASTRLWENRYGFGIGRLEKWFLFLIRSPAERRVPVVEPRTGSDLYPLKDKRSWRGCLSTLLRGSCQGGWGTTAAPAWTALKLKHF